MIDPEDQPTDDDLMTDDAKLIAVLLRSGQAETAETVAEVAGVDKDYAVAALRRMTELDESGDPDDYPIIRRGDLGPDVYEAIDYGAG